MIDFVTYKPLIVNYDDVIKYLKKLITTKTQKKQMEMIYYGGIGKYYALPEKIDFHKEVILSYEIKKLKGWKSPNLVIVFTNRVFEQIIIQIAFLTPNDTECLETDGLLMRLLIFFLF